MQCGIEWVGWRHTPKIEKPHTYAQAYLSTSEITAHVHHTNSKSCTSEQMNQVPDDLAMQFNRCSFVYFGLVKPSPPKHIPPPKRLATRTHCHTSKHDLTNRLWGRPTSTPYISAPIRSQPGLRIHEPFDKASASAVSAKSISWSIIARR